MTFEMLCLIKIGHLMTYFVVYCAKIENIGLKIVFFIENM